MKSSSNRAVYRVTIEGTMDDVWRELTRTDRPQRAMFNSVLHTDALAAGGQLRMRTPNGRYTGVVGEYITVEEPVRLAHTMKFTSFEDPACTVTFDMAQVERGVELTLTIDDVPVGTKSEKHLRQGGGFIVKNLKAIVETGGPTLGARLLFVLFRLLEPTTPKRARSEHWPLPQAS